MRKIAVVALCLLMCASFFACTTSYRTTLSAAEVSATAIEALGASSDYMDGTRDNFDFYFAGNEGADLVTDCSLMFHEAETNVNEIGILRVASTKDAAAVEALTRSYLGDRVDDLRSFAANYSQGDMAKLDNADVVVKGTYVIYFILSAEDESVALSAIEKLLAE